MNPLKASLAAALLALATTSCGYNNDIIDPNSGAEGGFMTADVGVIVFEAATVTARLANSVLTVTGETATGKTLTLVVNGITTTVSLPRVVTFDALTTDAVGFARYTEPGSFYTTAFGQGGGTFTITALNAELVEGSFSFRVDRTPPIPGVNSYIQVIGGELSIKF